MDIKHIDLARISYILYTPNYIGIYQNQLGPFSLHAVAILKIIFNSIYNLWLGAIPVAKNVRNHHFENQ